MISVIASRGRVIPLPGRAGHVVIFDEERNGQGNLEVTALCGKNDLVARSRRRAQARDKNIGIENCSDHAGITANIAGDVNFWISGDFLRKFMPSRSRRLRSD
jgi:hypothetical protein